MKKHVVFALRMKNFIKNASHDSKIERNIEIPEQRNLTLIEVSGR